MTTRSTRQEVPHRSAAFAVDPYRIDDCTFTRSQILRARGMQAPRAPKRSRSVPHGRRPRAAA